MLHDHIGHALYQRQRADGRPCPTNHVPREFSAEDHLRSGQDPFAGRVRSARAGARALYLALSPRFPARVPPPPPHLPRYVSLTPRYPCVATLDCRYHTGLRTQSAGPRTAPPHGTTGRTFLLTRGEGGALSRFGGLPTALRAHTVAPTNPTTQLTWQPAEARECEGLGLCVGVYTVLAWMAVVPRPPPPPRPQGSI